MTEPSERDSWYVVFGIYGAVGIQLSTLVVLGLWCGHWIDGYFGTSPWLTIIGLVIGCIGGFYNLIRIMNWQQNRKS